MHTGGVGGCPALLHWHMKQTRQLGTLLGCVSWCVLRIPGDVNRIYVHTIGVRVITRALYVMVWSVRVITLTPVHMLAHLCPLRYTGMDLVLQIRVIARTSSLCQNISGKKCKKLGLTKGFHGDGVSYL